MGARRATSVTTTVSANASDKVIYMLSLIILGAYGEIRLCVHRETQVQRCVKVVRKNKLNETQKKSQIEEYRILKDLVSYLFSLI